MITLTNTTVEEIIVMGILFRESGEDNSTHEIPKLEQLAWAENSEVLVYIANGDLLLKLNDVEITDVSKAIDILKDLNVKPVKITPYPFREKILEDGKKTFTRVHGISASVQGASDNIDFVIPYTNCKITGMEVIGGVLGDVVNFKVLDTPTGTISTIPNYELNQFGFNVAVSSGFYKYVSEYPADLIQNMKIRLEYDAKDELLPRTVYINLFLHQIVDA